ncbi:MAG: flippase-like domain-containing protein [Anaerolineales bacterium]|nr:flippase-like domain-containing protein [Anaerolineales bacterium]
MVTRKVTEDNSKSNIPIVRIVGTLIAVALMIFLLTKQDWAAMQNALSQIEWWRFVIAIGLMFCSRFFYVARWHFLVTSAGMSFSFWTSLRLTFAGLFSNNFLPTTIGGDVVRFAGALQRKEDPIVSGATLVMDRLSGMITMALLLPFGIQALVSTPIETSAISVTLPGFIKKLPEKIKSLVKRVWDAFLLWKDKPGYLFLSMGANVLHIIAILLFFSIFLTGMNEDVPIFLIGGLWSLVYFITLLPISINGWGLQEASIAQLFITFAVISPESAWSIAFLFRLMMMFASLPGALFVSDILPDLKRNKNK